MQDEWNTVKIGFANSTVELHIFEDNETVFSIVGKNLTNPKVTDPGFASVDYPLMPLTVIAQIKQNF